MVRAENNVPMVGMKAKRREAGCRDPRVGFAAISPVQECLQSRPRLPAADRLWLITVEIRHRDGPGERLPRGQLLTVRLPAPKTRETIYFFEEKS